MAKDVQYTFNDGNEKPELQIFTWPKITLVLLFILLIDFLVGTRFSLTLYIIEVFLNSRIF